MLPSSPRKRACIIRDDSGFHQEEEDPVFSFPLCPTLQESFGFLQEDLRNPPKQGSSDSASLHQGSFPQVEPVDQEDKAALPLLGNSSFMYTAIPYLELPICSRQERKIFHLSLSSFLESQLLAQGKDLCMAIAFLSLNL